MTFYAIGRGGVLGDVGAAEVDEVFFFFKPGLVEAMVEKGRASVKTDAAVAAHLRAADDYAAATFGAVDEGVLIAFSRAAATLADSLPAGRWPLVDGYLALEVPAEPAPAAYLWSIVLRELRGGVHTDAVKDAGLTGAQACQLDRGGAYFALHGYGDADRSSETDELREARMAVERDTSERMATLLSILAPGERDALVEGAREMRRAVDAPSPVN